MMTSNDGLIAAYSRAGWWRESTLHGLAAAHAARTPQLEALVDPINRPKLTGEAPARLTWAALHDKVLAFAAALHRNGVGPGDVVVAQLPNTHEAAVMLLACGHLGAILSPIALQFRASEIGRVIEATQARVFVTMGRVREFEHASYALAHVPAGVRVLGLGPALPDGVDPLLGADASAHAPPARTAANDIVTVCWTSGTEAKPKGVPRSHNHWLAVARTKPQQRADEVYLCAFPLVAMASIGGQLVPWLHGGGRFVLHHPFDLDLYLEQIRSERVTYTSAPPAILLRVLDARPAPADLASLAAIGTGSAPLAPDMLAAFEEGYGIEIHNNFGSNEGCSIYARRAEIADARVRATHFPAASWRPGAAPYDGSAIETRLVDPASGADVQEIGVAGELLIRGPTVFDGYWGDDGRPDRRGFDADGYFRTGDSLERVRIDDVPMYRFVARLKEVIVRGGMKISPAELEEHLVSHPLLVEAACIGYPDPILGERVAAFVVPRDGKPVELDAVTAFLRERGVATYKLPEKVRNVAALPRNPNNKVVRADLRRLLDERRST
ncbi:MAG: acyl--CoA ligase [Burkholderiaceae bacterium]|nr:acyl--CoA ligase [Burkholderiaceae bacterium]NLZ41881.1 acyl--CoA ligase [Comamonadaceae bacterium]